MSDSNSVNPMTVSEGRQRAQLAYLTKVADQIKDEDKKVQEGMRHSLKHALRAGKLLSESKKLVGHGGWLAWFETNDFTFKERTAQRYMSIYHRGKELTAKLGGKANPTALTDLTFTEAIELLAEQKRKASPKGKPTTATKTNRIANARTQNESPVHTIETVLVGPQRSDHWLSPEVIVEQVVLVLGRIDLDPAADEEKRIGAAKHYTQSDDGLAAEHPWQGRVFLNPPIETAMLERFVSRLVDEYRAGQVSEAFLLTAAMTDAEWLRSYAAFPRVFIRREACGMVSGMPDPLVAIYLGPNVSRFFAHFLSIGDGFVAYQKS